MTNGVNRFEISFSSGILHHTLCSTACYLLMFQKRRTPIAFLKATFHLTISMRGQRATGKIQRNNYHHGNCGPSLTGKTMSVFVIFTQGTHRNVKNR